MTKQRILFVDDHEVVRLGLKALLDHHSQFEVVGEAGNAKDAIEQVGRIRPDVVLMDIRLPGHLASKPVKRLRVIIRRPE